MGDAVNRTSIEWTDYTTNLIRYRDPEGRSVHGCIKVSAGCANCYASAISKRFSGGEFTASRQKTLTPYFDDAEAQRILRTRVTGKRVFVGDMTDVFGEWVPDALLDRMFAVFAMRPDLTFQLLTKRPERMRAYVASERRDTQGAIAVTIREVVTPEQVTAAMQEHRTHVLRDVVQRRWPLPNVWLGVSVEDQAAADDRIPELLNTPAAVRFLSCEPLLGPVDLRPWLPATAPALDRAVSGYRGPDIDWVIVGGESGPGARPCDVGWIRDIVQQCKAAAVPVFVKQLGRRPYDDIFAAGWAAEAGGYPPHAVPWVPDFGANWAPRLRSRKGADPAEWPEDLRVREWPR